MAPWHAVTNRDSPWRSVLHRTGTLRNRSASGMHRSITGTDRAVILFIHMVTPNHDASRTTPDHPGGTTVVLRTSTVTPGAPRITPDDHGC
ncbi:MAG: hypothetical protein ABW185_26025 [Sedimenticola sp.]